MLECAYKVNGYGSELLFQALKDPSIEIEGTDDSLKRPVMDKLDRLHGQTYFPDKHKMH